MPEIFKPSRFWRVVGPLLPANLRDLLADYYAASAEYRARLSIWLIGGGE